MRGRFRRAAHRDDRGAVAIEFAMVAGLLALIFSGIFDVGLAWRRSIEMSGTIRAGGRVVSNLGDYERADYETLQALNAGIVEIGSSNVNRVIVYKSDTADGAVPTECLSQTPSDNSPVGVSNKCNVYSRNQLETLTTGDFTPLGATNCSDTTKWDRFFCPVTDRETLQGSGLTYIGIWIEVTYAFPIGLVPGDGLTMTDSVVHRVEPEL